MQFDRPISFITFECFTGLKENMACSLTVCTNLRYQNYFRHYRGVDYPKTIIVHFSQKHYQFWNERLQCTNKNTLVPKMCLRCDCINLDKKKANYTQGSGSVSSLRHNVIFQHPVLHAIMC